ncbi:MAG: hypothetical protein OXU30_02275, partial [Gammaproteobacteria bacterium]|nr:hypothetical protein [Gammaproteobacteria bacterium]
MDPKQFLTQIVQTFKQFVLKYYPKDHLYIAGSMAALFLLLLIIPGEDKGPAVPNQTTRIPIPVTLDAPGSEPSSSLNLADYVVTAEAPAEINLWQNVEIKSGDNLSAIFTKVGLSDQDLFRVLNSSEEAKILNRVYPGYQLDFLIPDEGELEQLRVLKSPLEGYLFTRENNDYLVQEIIKEAQIHQAFKVGEISDSLFMAGQREQIPTVHLMELANIFGGVIDFILDPRLVDQFSILYNE